LGVEEGEHLLRPFGVHEEDILSIINTCGFISHAAGDPQ
jgi:hypothetical protein